MNKEWSLFQYGIRIIFIGILSAIVAIICGKKGIEKLKACQLMNSGKYDQPIDLDLLERWHRKWNSLHGAGDSAFADMFIKVYKETAIKSIINKNKNFVFKFLFIGIMMFFLLSFTLYGIWNMQNNEMILNGMVENGFLLLIFLLALFIIAKWLDVKKYQETWARHYYHMFLLDYEISLFLNRLDIYDNESPETEENIHQIFKKRFFEIEKGNAERFLHNMDKKELQLLDGIRNLTGKSD